MGDQLESSGPDGPLLPEQIRRRPLRLALSGGGFRATLFSLGALLYVVDSGENRHVRSIASVSGASVLNALVMQAGDFRKMAVGDIDRIAAKALATITTTGLLRASVFTYAYLGIVGVGALYLGIEALFRWPIGLTWLGLVVGFVITAGLLLLRGMLIVRMMAHRFFAAGGPPPILGDLKTSVRHHLCCTDLNTASRAYFTVGGDRPPELTVEQLDSAPVPEFRLDHAVRASAAFPGGVPPKRVVLADVGLPWKKVTHHVPPVLKSMRKRKPLNTAVRVVRWLRRRLRLDAAKAIYLTDGGVFNNLATDVDEDTDMILVVDASAPLSSAPLRRLSLPGLAELGSLARAMSVLYTNTVDPRIEHLQDRASLILSHGDKVGDGTGFPVIVRITDNTTQGLRRIYTLLQRANRPVDADSRKAASKAVSPVWNAVAKHIRDTHGLGPFAADSPDVPTTFNRIPAPVALMLMLHGYLATMFSLGAARGSGIGHVEVERFKRLLRGEVGDEPGFNPDYHLGAPLGIDQPDVL